MNGRIISTFLLLCVATSAGAADWPFFRGPNRDGTTKDAAPLEWSRDKNIKWTVKLPMPGNSSPIVTGERVFVTCAQDKKGMGRSLYSFDRATGKELWVKTIQMEKPELTHATNPYCSSSPATDGQHVVVWHGSGGLHCYDLGGKELWNADLGTFSHIWGYGSSPIIHNGIVYLNAGPGVRSFVVAFKISDGQELWRTDEPDGADDKSPKTKNWLGSWSTGVISKIDGVDQLVVFQPFGPKAYDLKSGKVLWSVQGAGPLAYTDVLLGDGIGVTLAGFTGAAIGFKPGIDGQKPLWRKAEKIPQRIGSGVVVGDHVFMPHEPGTITCFDIATGNESWSHREPGQTFWSSIVKANDRLYLTSQQGATYVFAPDITKWTPLATNELGEKVNATPAVSNNQIFIRTFDHLYCIGE